MKNKLLSSVILTFLLSTFIFSQNWNAVCVGINDYPGSGSDLQYCVRDAEYMRTYLINHKQWNSNRINLLTDGNANETAIHSAISNMPRSAGNTNFFSFSGHGDSQELGGNDGLIPANSLSARITQDELQTDFGSTYNQCTSFLDACGSGIFPSDLNIGVISSACRANEYAWESSSIQHGYYSYYLLQGLGQTNITTSEHLHNYAAPLVSQAVGQLGYQQHPQIGDRFIGYLGIYNAPYSLSGTLSRYETWSAASTLQGNVYVPSGIILTLTSNLNLNLNGYSIISTGGDIITQSGFSTTGALVKTGSVTKGIYSSINSALNAATSGQIVVVFGSHTSVDNLSVSSGVTLSINPGVIITFNATKKISVWGGGTFTANGATFKGNGAPGYWHSISYFSNSSGSIQNSTIKDAQCGIYTNNASINISNNTITNNSIYGLSILQNSNAPVSNCVISNNGTGINLYSSDITITGNNILNNTNYGINANNVSNNYIYWHSNNLHGNGYAMLLNNASPWIGHSNFSDNAHGVVMTSSLTSFAVVPNLDERMRGYNVIACNTATPNFKADNYSSVYAGYGYDGGYNSIYGSELPDMESRNNSGIYACNNYWGSPYPAIYADGTSWILAWYPLNEDPNPSCYNKSSASFANTEVIEGDFSNVFWEAISEGRRGNLQRAKELLLSIINGKYDSKYSPLALLAFYDFITNTSSRDSINTGLNTVLTGVYDRAKSDSLRPFAVRLLARENALSDNLNKMIFFNNEIIDNYPNSVNELTALYDLITYYSVIENDIIKAQALFTRMLNNYPEEDLTKFAAINLGYNFENLKKNVSSEENPASYELSNAYPNPFNPSTMISYSLRDEGRVSIKVYDILGSEVATLVNETKPAGTYEVEFNASQLPSGVYIYRMQAGSYTASKKMLLVK